MSRLTDPKYLKEILGRHGIVLTKARGQNFLVNPSVCPQMADMCGATENDGVIEIGPGVGVLTEQLAKISKKTVAIELDSGLIPVLGETLKEYENVKVIHEDALKIDLVKLIEDEFDGGDVYLCANLPYYITTP
ncbi:MAG: 16S rRNA (adenine(1518)-N(6)/adenine(1519)-N(6))-dimethyltransferase, partial [Clostridia bacterium]|nr:16S rRNA (adenine(1518)-N(6)/adenine(1519)-N(6))-dimethyltransferase [Clostridia bacterium]